MTPEDAKETKDSVPAGRLVSIVVPVFNEAPNLALLLERCESVTSKLPHLKWEYVFVNDIPKSPVGKILRRELRDRK